MKVAVLADIHANYTALLAVAAHVDAWRPDAVVVAGDTVNRGPRSRDCLNYVQQRQHADGWQIIRGNHEEYVITLASDPAPRPGVDGAVRQSVRWTFEQLGGVAELLAMPLVVSLRGPDGSELRVTHASMRGTRDNIFPNTDADLLRTQIAPPPALFCAGHTHLPFIRQLDDTLVVNAGSVGLPFDGDRRACYAQLEWQAGCWYAELVRLPYDWQAAERDFSTTGFLAEGGIAAEVILDEFRVARSRLFRWVVEYEPRVAAGDLTVTESVAEYLARLAAEP